MFQSFFHFSFSGMILLFLLPSVFAAVADYATVPKGLNPTLYSSDDFVVQLDESTFNDTVYCTGTDCSSHLVEFYSDWCGHCRAFSPLYKSLANDIKGWSRVVKIAAMNCADSVNEVTCRANGVQYFPYIKYFPRNSSSRDDGSLLRPLWSISEMREQLTKVVMDDYSVNRFEDWPTFDHLGDLLTYGDLWEGTPSEVQHMAIIFENHQASLTGAELLLDLHKYKDNLVARRCLKNHPLVEALHITDFPSMAIFKRGEKKPILVAELRRLLLTEIENFLNTNSDRDLQQIHFSHHRKNKTSICDTEPEKCRALFYVSEVDMLKAMRYALYRETARTGAPLTGSNLTALLTFVNLLAEHFPVVSRGINETYLDRSNRAVRVFTRLRDYLQQKGEGATVTVEEWQKEFDDAEAAAGNPFPVTADWDHCRGSTGQYRGYTCGLWTSFHTLTVSAYRQALAASNLNDFQPLSALQAIREWVGAFFGCEHCRAHFLKMTTNTFKMENQVSAPEDVFMYLWKAHNIVNARLRGRDTEDPKFPKYPFPANFLCDNCSSEQNPMNETIVREFLLDYYSNIKPYTQQENVFARLRR